MTINSRFESIQNTLTLNELAKDSLVAVEVGSFAKRDGELGSARILTAIGKSKHATFIVSQCHVLILKSHAEGTHVLLTEATTRDSKAGLTLVEGRA